MAHDVNEARFFFFLPRPAEIFAPVVSCGVEASEEEPLGVVPRPTGAGVAEVRRLVPATTDSGGLLSTSDTNER